MINLSRSRSFFLGSISIYADLRFAYFQNHFASIPFIYKYLELFAKSICLVSGLIDVEYLLLAAINRNSKTSIDNRMQTLTRFTSVMSKPRVDK